MNVRQIVMAHLKAGGFDGLAVDDCGCGIDDLMPCDGYGIDRCKPANAVPCDGTCFNCEKENEGGVCYRVADQSTDEEETHL